MKSSLVIAIVIVLFFVQSFVPELYLNVGECVWLFIVSKALRVPKYILKSVEGAMA